MSGLKTVARKAIEAINMIAPNVGPLNYALAAPHFKARNGRLPRNPASPTANLNDFVFARMVRNRWTPQQIRAVDKDLAKAEAISLCPMILVPKTLAVIPVGRSMTNGNLTDALAPYLGQRAVAKPTHGSGVCLFLDQQGVEKQFDKLLSSAKQDFWKVMRETQYAHLEKKIIVEQNISDNAVAPIDYKFFCFSGQPEFCQVDIGRHELHRRAIFDLPSGKRSTHIIGPFPAAGEVKLPDNFQAMVECASQLSRPFDFVRIDLYSINSMIYFSEFTFSPGAATERHQNDEAVVGLVKKIAASN